MKKQSLQSLHFKQLEIGFREWLDILGYAESTIKRMPLQVRELLHYLEERDLYHIHHLTSTHIKSHVKELQKRGNQRYGGGLSSSTINYHITAINLFTSYLVRNGVHTIDYSPKRLRVDANEREILTPKEIKQLYEASYYEHRQGGTAFSQRDRAILSLLYGCGLRKSEAIHLNVSDIDFNKRVLFVRKGKGGKQRYVPIFGRVVEDLENYLQSGRYWFLEKNAERRGQLKKDTDREAVLLGLRGKRLRTFDFVLENLRERSGIETKFSAHNLRHSIATHLLQKGMNIEEIAKFLGHTSLESTQIYTHIIEKEGQENELS